MKTKINFFLIRKVMTAQEYIYFCKNLISKLKQFDSIFDRINIVNIEEQKVYSFLSDLSDFNFSNLYSVLNEENITYNNKGLDNTALTINSESWSGFSLTVFGGGSSDMYSKPDVTLNISQGAYDGRRASIRIDYSDRMQYKLTKEYIIELMNVVSQVVNIIFANAITDTLFFAVREKGKYSIGLINYFSDERVFSLLPEDVGKKKLPDGGCIFWLSEKKVSSIDEQSIRKALGIREILSIEGLCNIK